MDANLCVGICLLCADERFFVHGMDVLNKQKLRTSIWVCACQSPGAPNAQNIELKGFDMGEHKFLWKNGWMDGYLRRESDDTQRADSFAIFH